MVVTEIHTCNIMYIPVKENEDENESVAGLMTWLSSPSQNGIPVQHSVVTPLIHASSLTSSGVVTLA